MNEHVESACINTDSPCNVSVFAGELVVDETQNPNKKRIRRNKQELDHLRRESKKLEDELAQLLQIQAHRPSLSSIRPKTRPKEKMVAAPGYCTIAPRRLVQKPSMWQGIAERQSIERGRALARNVELRAQLEAEYKLGRQLIQLLDRQFYAKALIQGKCHGPLIRQDDVFKQQLQQAEDTLLTMKKELLGRNDGGKDVFVMQASVTLPFSVQATASALWKVLSTDEIMKHCYHHRVAHKAENVVAQSFGIRFEDDSLDADIRGNYTFSRLQDDDCFVIVWVAANEPVELNGTKCRGEISERTEAKATLVRSSSRLHIESVAEETPPLRPLVSFAQRFHDRFMATHSSVLEKALIEK
ncbi:hypothetical protein GN958_ATG04975 [Phytophthora infestans]|uniref:M96 mating-specific protein family n=1 Tax=Phytophthora infestans TaxID=4787 RepID=A0A8S9UXM5_PHYIN|nr:hypothetical protein GN958_ATG23693 [Phytophthora infestans]KAF4145835.1 hypothetical protein GN958_ATG04975 [Phytophthora infestans]